MLYLSFVATWPGYGLWGRLLMRYPVAQVAPLPCWCPASAWWPQPCCWMNTHPFAVAGLRPGAARLLVHLLGGRMRLFRVQAED